MRGSVIKKLLSRSSLWPLAKLNIFFTFVNVWANTLIHADCSYFLNGHILWQKLHQIFIKHILSNYVFWAVNWAICHSSKLRNLFLMHPSSLCSSSECFVMWDLVMMMMMMMMMMTTTMMMINRHLSTYFLYLSTTIYKLLGFNLPGLDLVSYLINFYHPISQH